MKTTLGFSREARCRGLLASALGCMRCMLLGWLLAVVPGAVHAAEPMEELTAAQREQLGKDAAKLDEQAQLAVLRDPGRVLQKYAELRTELVKRGVPDAELQARGFGKELKDLPYRGRIEERQRSPARWWAGFVLAGCDEPR